MRSPAALVNDTQGSALVEFAVALPLLVVFIVGIYDFSGAFNQKQKIEHAAEQGAIVAGAQPMNDIETGNSSPDSLQPVVNVIFSSLDNADLLPRANKGSCKVPAAGTPGANPLQWTYAITGCSSNPSDVLAISIDRGFVTNLVTAPPTTIVSTQVVVSYPYHWRFNSVIQLLVPGASYAAVTNVSETATVHNQM
jgi:Flp pilus assembly protein TadG